MRKIVLIICLFLGISQTIHCQFWINNVSQNTWFWHSIKVTDSIQSVGKVRAPYYLIGAIDTAASKRDIHATSMNYNGNRPVTRVGIPNVTVGGTTLDKFIENYFFPTTYPRMTIPADTSVEYSDTLTSVTSIFAVTATRPAWCSPIISITQTQAYNDSTASNPTSFTLDSPFDTAHTQTIHASITFIPYYTNKLTPKFFMKFKICSSDKCSGYYKRTYNLEWRYYWGAFASAVPPTDGSFSISDTQIKALSSSTLTNTRVRNFNGINGGGNYLVFAFPSSWGTPTFYINGLTNTSYTKVRDNAFVNIKGGTTNYQVWVSATPLNSPIAQFDIK